MARIPGLDVPGSESCAHFHLVFHRKMIGNPLEVEKATLGPPIHTGRRSDRLVRLLPEPRSLLLSNQTGG